MPAEPARQFWPREADTARARDVDPLDRNVEKNSDQSIHPSDRHHHQQQQQHQSSAREARAPKIGPARRALARWLEQRVPVRGPAGRVQETGVYDSFHGARAFVATFGWRLILTAIHDMTYTETTEVGDKTYRDRYWRHEIKSPARYLNYYVRELAKQATADWEESFR